MEHQDDADFFGELKTYYEFIDRIYVVGKSFDDAIIEVEIVFEKDYFADIKLYESKFGIPSLIGTIVFRFIRQFYYNSQRWKIRGNSRYKSVFQRYSKN